MKTQYQVTICYKAIITINIDAENEEEAKIKSVEVMKRQRDKMFKINGFDLQYDGINFNNNSNLPLSVWQRIK